VRQVFDGEVVFEDNVRATGLAELWFGSPENMNCRHLISLVVDEGIGGAIIIAGQLYHGATLGAGQFGQMSLHAEGPACRCGNRGCWEVYASDGAAIGRYQEASLGQTTSRSITMRELVDRVLSGEQAAVQAIQKTAEYLGAGMAILANALNPEEIILEGEVARAWPVMEDAVWSSLRKKALAANIAFLKLRPTTIAGDASLQGAISLVISRRFRVRKGLDRPRASRSRAS
jgi:predicted NBD/HSP70 family sugar kinase